jgi:hypothetical protein
MVRTERAAWRGVFARTLLRDWMRAARGQRCGRDGCRLGAAKLGDVPIQRSSRCRLKGAAAIKADEYGDARFPPSVERALRESQSEATLGRGLIECLFPTNQVVQANLMRTSAPEKNGRSHASVRSAASRPWQPLSEVARVLQTGHTIEGCLHPSCGLRYQPTAGSGAQIAIIR